MQKVIIFFVLLGIPNRPVLLVENDPVSKTFDKVGHFRFRFIQTFHCQKMIKIIAKGISDFPS